MTDITYGMDYSDNIDSSGTITITTDTCDSTITLDNDLTFTLDNSNTITLDSIYTDPTITVGNVVLKEDDVNDLLTLLNVIKELDDNNPIKELFNHTKMLNKIKGEKVDKE